MADKDYEKAHKELQHIMEEASKQYYGKEIEEYPRLDLSFMKKDCPRTKKSRRIKRYAAIAAGIMVVFFAGSALSMFLSGDAAYGEKGVLHRIYKSVMGIDTDQQDAALPEEYVETFETTSMDSLEDGVDFVNGRIYVPEYLPGGYDLKKLSIEKTGDGVVTAVWELKKGEKEFSINEIYTGEDDDGGISASGEGELIRLKDRVLYVREADSGEEQCIGVYTEDAIIQIYGNVTEAEGIEIAKGLKLRK